jgi:hypothetical protein
MTTWTLPNEENLREELWENLMWRL